MMIKMKILTQINVIINQNWMLIEKIQENQDSLIDRRLNSGPEFKLSGGFFLFPEWVRRAHRLLTGPIVSILMFSSRNNFLHSVRENHSTGFVFLFVLILWKWVHKRPVVLIGHSVAIKFAHFPLTVQILALNLVETFLFFHSALKIEVWSALLTDLRICKRLVVVPVEKLSQNWVLAVFMAWIKLLFFGLTFKLASDIIDMQSSWTFEGKIARFHFLEFLYRWKCIVEVYFFQWLSDSGVVFTFECVLFVLNFRAIKIFFIREKYPLDWGKLFSIIIFSWDSFVNLCLKNRLVCHYWWKICVLKGHLVNLFSTGYIWLLFVLCIINFHSESHSL